MDSRLRVVVRADLSPAQQAVQGAHSSHEYLKEFPHSFHEWASTSNTLAFLCVEDEEALEDLYITALQAGICASAFREPDRGDELTAICLEPSESSKKLCSGLALALKDP